MCFLSAPRNRIASLRLAPASFVSLDDRPRFHFDLPLPCFVEVGFLQLLSFLGVNFRFALNLSPLSFFLFLFFLPS